MGMKPETEAERNQGEREVRERDAKTEKGLRRREAEGWSTAGPERRGCGPGTILEKGPHPAASPVLSFSVWSSVLQRTPGSTRMGLPEGILPGTGAGKAAREVGFGDAGPGLHMGTCRPPPHSPWLQLTRTSSQRAIGGDGTADFNAQGGSVWTANLYKSHQAKSMPSPAPSPPAPSQNTPYTTNGRKS